MTHRNLPRSMSLETRTTRLLMHLYHRIREEHGHKWMGELDAIDDVIFNNRGGMREWTVTKDGLMHWWGEEIPT